MKDYFRQVSRITAEKIFVPKNIRHLVPTKLTSSGTRLTTKRSGKQMTEERFNN